MPLDPPSLMLVTFTAPSLNSLLYIPAIVYTVILSLQLNGYTQTFMLKIRIMTKQSECY